MQFIKQELLCANAIASALSLNCWESSFECGACQIILWAHKVNLQWWFVGWHGSTQVWVWALRRDSRPVDWACWTALSLQMRQKVYQVPGDIVLLLEEQPQKIPLRRMNQLLCKLDTSIAPLTPVLLCQDDVRKHCAIFRSHSPRQAAQVIPANILYLQAKKGRRVGS